METQENLLKEYGEVWAHYRHLEVARSTYMNFFFAALFVVFGFFSTILDLQWVMSVNNYLTYLAVLFIFSMFTLYIFINVCRIGWVLEGYGKIMGVLKSKLFSQDTINRISIYQYLPSIMGKLFSIQKSSLFLLISTMASLNALVICTMILNWNTLSTVSSIILLIVYLILMAIKWKIVINGKRAKIILPE